ncbi:MAG: GFA family protein, partial [Polymorphobacter sp.]
AQARFPAENVKIIGEFRLFARTADSDRSLTYRFCPNCGSTVAYQIDILPGFVAIPQGAFGDGDFPAPAYSNYERRKRPWVSITGDGVEHLD